MKNKPNTFPCLMMLFEAGLGVAEYVHVHSEDDLRRIYAKFQEKRNNNTGWSCTAALHPYSTEFSATDAEHHADVVACMAEPSSSTKEPKPTYEQLEAKIVLLEGWLAERRKEVDRLYQEGRNPRGVIEMLQQELHAERETVASLQRRLWDDGTYIRKLKEEIAELREKAVPTFGAPIAGMTFPFTIDTPHRDTVEITVTGVDAIDGKHRVHMTADIRLPEAQPQEAPSPAVEPETPAAANTSVDKEELLKHIDIKTTNPDAPPFVDPHTYTASKMFGVSFKEVTEDMRTEAKTASFRDAFRNELDVLTATDPTPPHDKGFLVYDDATTAVEPDAPAEDTTDRHKESEVLSSSRCVGGDAASGILGGNTVGRSREHSNLLAYEQAGAVADSAPKLAASAADATENYDAQAEQAVRLESINAHLAEDTESMKNTTVLSTELVPFHGSMLEAGKADGKVWVIVRRVCEAIEIDYSGQHQRLSKPKRCPWACVGVMPMHDATGRVQQVFCIDMDSVPMWLATINASRVAPHLREKLVLFQKEAAKVLRDHFLGKASFAAPTDDVGALKVALRLAEKNARLVEDNARLLEEKAANSSAMLLLSAENDGQAELITWQQAELTQYQAFVKSDASDSGVSTVAGSLGYNEQFFFSLMREHGLILNGRKGGWSYGLHTDPYKEHIDKGWFVLRPNLRHKKVHPYTKMVTVEQSYTTRITNLGAFELTKMYGENGTHWNSDKPAASFHISPNNMEVTEEERMNYRRRLWSVWNEEAKAAGRPGKPFPEDRTTSKKHE